LKGTAICHLPPVIRPLSSLIHFFTAIKIDSMIVHVQTLHFDADSKLIDYVNKKIQKLQQYHDRIIKVDVFLILDNVVHTIKDKVAEIRVHVPKSDFFVKATSKSFEVSFEEALEALIQQIKRKKQKQVA
jgi:putative sigma-54 modulation protein